jgi:IS605 OrfB family transposase
MKITICGKVKNKQLYNALSNIAAVMGRVERMYFRDRYIVGKNANELKRTFLKEHGITGRQLNGIIFNLGGKVESARECLLRNLDAKKTMVAKVGSRLKIEINRKKKNWFKVHQYRRQVSNLEHKITVLEAEIKSGIPSICFGSRSLFHQQFHLAENGYSNHAEWLNDWQQRRASQFYCLGSKDESFGNQTCQLLPKGLHIRIPDCLSGKHGKYIEVPVVFPHGQEILNSALLAGQAISYLFIRKEKGWYVHATTERVEIPIVTDRKHGSLGLDLNADLIAVSRIDSSGNPTESWDIQTLLLNKTKHQISAIIGDAVGSIVQYAKANLVPIVIEGLDLDKKKSGANKKTNRKVSMLAYSAFKQIVLSHAFKEGVEVITINPAYTSVIGMVKFGSGYRLTPHQGAAVAIARRGLGFGERLTARRLRYTFSLPVRNRLKHVWSDWRIVSRMLDRKSRSGSRQSSSPDRGIPLSKTAVSSDPVLDGSPGSSGVPTGGSQQHCSAGECETVMVTF